MAYIYDLSDQWAASGTTFTGIKLNVTDTASAAGSLLMDLQVGGSSKFKVDKIGNALFGDTSAFANGMGVGVQSINVGSGASVSSTFAGGQVNVWNANINVTSLNATGVSFRSTGGASWGSGTSTAGADLFILRDAANTLAQRNGVNAQAFNLYGTYTDGSNYRRIKTTMSTAGIAEIKPEGAGTGVSGNVLHISGLPTSNPGPGILWNNAGTPAIGT